MEKTGRAWQWYGYAVCLTAVITGLICISGVINNAFDLANPLAGERAEGSLTSFEAYKATRDRPAPRSDERQAQDKTLRMGGVVPGAVLVGLGPHCPGRPGPTSNSQRFFSVFT